MLQRTKQPPDHRSGGARRHGRIIDLGHLRTSADDAVTILILDDHSVLAFLVCALPDLNLHAPADDADAHGGEQVVGGVAVVVHTAVEHGGGILADATADHGLATRMVVDEVGHVVYDARDGDQTTAVGALVDVIVPFHHRELFERRAPVEPGALLVKLLLHLLQAALLDLVGAELLEVVGKAHLLPEPDGPFGGVVLVPLDGVAVVGRELVVEVVVALTQRDQRGDDVVAGAVAVVERLVAEPVGERVDAESGLLDEEDAEDAGVDEAAHPVTPAETCNQGREDQTHEKDHLEVVPVLPHHDRVIVQVGNVGAANSLRVLLHDHPAKVGVQQALADAVRVLVGVGVAMVGAMVTSPPSDGTFDGTAANCGQEDLQWQSRRVGSVSPQTVVARRNAETRGEIV